VNSVRTREQVRRLDNRRREAATPLYPAERVIHESEDRHMTKSSYRRVNVDGLNMFYREAGAADAPALLLLHGFPSSSHMFRDLIPMLADRFHIVAPVVRNSAVTRAFTFRSPRSRIHAPCQ
jgi:hypothetical protein